MPCQMPGKSPQLLDNFFPSSGRIRLIGLIIAIRLLCTVESVRPHHVTLSRQLYERLQELSAITENPMKVGTTRRYLSDAGIVARGSLLKMARESGATTRYVDAVGNVHARFSCIGDMLKSSKGEKKRRVLLLGSHFDSVQSGGMWDGAYGVVAGLAVAEILRPKLCHFPFDIEVVAFDDEEGASSYGVTNLGARAYTSSLNLTQDVLHLDQFLSRFSTVFGEDGVTLTADDVNSCIQASAVKNDDSSIVAFLELHIEQGPVLERARKSVGVVSTIAGQTRMIVQWSGERGHAGTVPMGLRRDALAAAAEGILFVEHVGKQEIGEKQALVTTVGNIQVLNGGGNIISGFTSMTVDIRSTDDAVRMQAVRQIMREFQEISIRRKVDVSIEVTNDVNAVHMTPWISDILAEVVSNGSTGATRLMSGAGHDTQFLARITDVGMLFVRCRHGISHSPEEFVSMDDAYEGAVALLHAVDSIARRIELK